MIKKTKLALNNLANQRNKKMETAYQIIRKGAKSSTRSFATFFHHKYPKTKEETESFLDYYFFRSTLFSNDEYGQKLFSDFSKTLLTIWKVKFNLLWLESLSDGEFVGITEEHNNFINAWDHSPAKINTHSLLM